MLLCACVHIVPPPPPNLSSPLNTFGAELPLWLKNANVSMAPFFLPTHPFATTTAKRGQWLGGGTCAVLMSCLISSDCIAQAVFRCL